MEKSVLEKIQDPYVENHYNMTSTNAQYPAPQHNGWVSNINDPNLKSFSARDTSLYAKGEPILSYDTRVDLVGHIHKETPLNKIFFSSENIEYLQREIQNQVRSMSGGKYNIGRQSDDDLKIIMRSYYLMFGQNNPNMVEQELHQLNSRVVGYSAGKIFSEVDFHMFYLKDIEDFAPPIANPTNVHVFGTRTGELKSFF
jgi:hypothetical protein